MRVNKQKLDKKFFEEQYEITLKIMDPCSNFISRITLQEYPEWKDNHMNDKYIIHKLDNGKTIKFQYKYVLKWTNHNELITIINHLLENFMYCSITYNAAYKNQIQYFIKDIKLLEMIIDNQIINRDTSSQFSFIYGIDQEQEIDKLIDRLRQFKQETLIFPMDKFLERGNISFQDYKYFLSGLVLHYSIKIKAFIHKNFKKLGLQDSIHIQKIQTFFKQDEKSGLYNGYNDKTGIKLDLYGFEETFSKMYKYLERWIKKLNFMVLEVEQISCCERSQLSQYFGQQYRNDKAALLNKSKQFERIVVFQPSKSKFNLEKDIQTAKRMISGRQFPNLHFETISLHKVKFENQLRNQHVQFQSLKIYEDYILVKCYNNDVKKLKSLIKNFLQDHQFQEVEVSYFTGSFEIAIFSKEIASKVTVKPIEFSVFERKLYRKNWKKHSEEIDQLLRDLYKQMRKKLVFRPSLKVLPMKQDYFREIPAPQWQVLECLESRRFKMDKRLQINIRSYGSIYSNEGEGVFIVDEITNCSQLLGILKEEESSPNITDRIMKNQKLGFTLRLSRYFDNIMTMVIKINQHRTKDMKWQRPIQKIIDQLIEQSRNTKNLKLIFPKQSEIIIECIVPIILEKILQNCKLLPDTKIREVTLFTSLEGGSKLRNQIVRSLRQMKEVNKGKVVIQKISDMDLRIGDIDKIVEYGYFSLKYLQQNKTKTASNINSFIFNYEKKKNGKTPIYLPQKNSSTNIQYLVCCFTSEIYKVDRKSTEKLKDKVTIFPQLKKVIETTLKYFPNLSYLVVYGNTNFTKFCNHMFLTSTAEHHYQILEEVMVDFDQSKITKGILKMKYKLVENEFISLKKIQTHSSLVPDLIQLMNGVQVG